MSAKLAVLGLVIEEPGPAYRLTAKLRQRLASAEFVDSNVYSALARLERDGLICAVSTEGSLASQAEPTRLGAGQQQFEATPAGLRVFEEWLLESTRAPSLRDELHMKIALCRPRDVPRLIDQLYGQEQICSARMSELRRSSDQALPPDPHRWSGCVMAIVRDAELGFWEARLTWLQDVRASLEKISVADVRK